ncbi:MAG: hypothetical protein LBL04_02560 [Bacteroidales bacterium]|jgi:hypothetical protein|nr:hypothetical protein [Bacteroidales bacterium]
MNITHLNIKKEKQLLSAAQKTFNRLNNRIAKLKNEIESFPRKMEIVSEFYREKLAPLKQQQTTLQYETIKRLDYMYGTVKLGKRQRETLLDMIHEELEDIHDNIDMEDARYEEMRMMHEKYMREQYGEEGVAEMEAETLNSVKSMAKKMLGLDLDGLENLSESEMEDFVQQKMDEIFQQQTSREEQVREQKRSSKKKLTPKQEEKKLETDASLKTLREVYTDLVKKLHPDREKDETLRIEKTEQMKLVTEAYDKKDLATLLLMQIKWLQHTDKDPMTQPDAVLARYNNVLKMHISKLEEEYRMLVWRPMPFDVGMDMFTVVNQNEHAFPYYLSKTEKEWKSQLACAERIFARIHTPEGLKQRIKEFQEDLKWENRNMMDFDMLDMLMR